MTDRINSSIRIALGISALVFGETLWAQESSGLTENPSAPVEASEPVEVSSPLGDEDDDSQGTEEQDEGWSDNGVQMVTSSYGALRLGLIVQTGYGFYPDDVEGKRNSFFISHARLFFDGFILNRALTYHVSGDALSGIAPLGKASGPGGEMLSDSTQDVPFLLDARLTWHLKMLNGKISVGRFVPKWGIMMPERVSGLGAIYYPLYVHGGENALGGFRSIGMDVELEIVRWLVFEGGVFNGGKNSWLDDNDPKDVLIGFRIGPLAALEIRVSTFFVFPKVWITPPDPADDPWAVNETQIRPNIEARYRDFGFDLILGGALSVVRRHEDDSRPDDVALGLMANVGYFIVGDWFQLMVRLDLWEPSVQTDDSAQVRLTAGPQFYLDDIHSFIRINYSYDRYQSAWAMCRNYLESTDCLDPDFSGNIPAEANQSANTLMVLLGVDI